MNSILNILLFRCFFETLYIFVNICVWVILKWCAILFLEMRVIYMEEKLEELKTLTEILNKQGITLETPQIKK